MDIGTRYNRTSNPVEFLQLFTSSLFKPRVETSVRWLISFLWPSKTLRRLGS
jgi:hypothetical protein